MRAFVAIALPETVLEELAHRQADFAASSGGVSGGNAGVRWVRPEGIHLTLKFLGEISDLATQELTAALGGLDRFPSFKVEVRGFGFFPDSKRPRVLWAGIRAGPHLAELALRIETATRALGFPAEDRPFSPHLTLARFRDSRPQPALQRLAHESSAASLGEFEVSGFCLFESRLARGAPPEYREIACFRLRS